MNKPLLSVCLITYNQAPYVKQALDSILMQKVDFPWELVIADDYSTDGTREIIKEYQKQHPDFIKLILQKKNVGAEQNWLELISYPKSKYIAYLEGDDYWTEDNKLQLQVDFLEKNPEYALCFHPAKIFFEKGEEKPTTWPNLTAIPEFTISELLKENFIPSNSAVYRRQNYTAIPRNIAPGDWYLHLYHAQFGEIGVIDKVMSAYRRHSGGAWWGSFQDKAGHWEKYGLPMLTLYAELMELYGGNPTYRQAISQGAAGVLEKLIWADQTSKQKLLKTALCDLPEITESALMYQDQHLQDLSSQLQTQSEKAETLMQEILDLRSRVFHLQDELHGLKNARLLGKIIRTRQIIGDARQKLSPRSILHQARVVGAPFVPAPARRTLKQLYRRLRVGIRKTSRPATIVTVKNTKWTSSPYLLTVVIPFYNRADTIDATLDSLRAQTFTSFEVILVDDGSTDPASIDKLKELNQDTLHLTISHEKNQGVAAARNFGINKARGKYIICLDSDDLLEPTYIEKSLLVLEACPDTALVTTHQQMFGVVNELFKKPEYDPLRLYEDNMVITASAFRKEAWAASGGYKSGIGYEDWEQWLSFAELGFWGKLIPEALFRYRTAMQSRYIDDKDIHWNNIKAIRSLHQNYKKRVRQLLAKRTTMHLADPTTAFVNLNQPKSYNHTREDRPNILITIPWMTFGGAETLIYNYCREIKDHFNLSFVTGLKSEHEWEYKFKELTEHVYHLANLFEDEQQYVEFISCYISTRNINVLHVIHNGFTFSMLETLKKRHPKLKVVVTMFNDRVEYFEQSIGYEQYIDTFVTDNAAVARHYQKKLQHGKRVVVIPNGINCYDEFNLQYFDRPTRRKELGIEPKDLAVFFVGRLSPEKNPDVFLHAADAVLRQGHNNVKFFVVGDGPQRPEIDRLLHQIGSKKITYLGYQAMVAKFLCAADIFVLPSSIEGFPLSILEAMAMKNAIIASDVGAVAEVVGSGKCGFVVSPGSVSEITDAINKLIQNPKLLTSMKQQARKRVESQFSNIKLGDNYKQLYKEVIKS